jgi:cysteine-S-conjugate beta-lyase
MKKATKLVTAGRDPAANHGIVNPPVYHASTILFRSAETFRNRDQQYVYGRRGTPTSTALETAVAEIEGGHASCLTSSGLAAICTALMAFARPGDHVLIADTVYRPTRNFADTMLARIGVTVEYYDPLIGAGIADLLRDDTTVVFTESPGSQTFEVQDLPAIARAAHAGGAVVITDNTWASPYYFDPFSHGADVSVQAATKYIVGHSDVMMGTITASEEHWPTLRETHLLLGQCAGPDDIYLALRGLRTLGVRLRQHMESGIALATWLEQRPEVVEVMHPALPSHSGHDLWRRDFGGASGLFSIRLKSTDRAAVDAMIDGLALFGIGASWGGFESLVLPFDPTSYRSATPWTRSGHCIRIHAGLEDVDDLKADLDKGFERLNARS